MWNEIVDELRRDRRGLCDIQSLADNAHRTLVGSQILALLLVRC